MHTSSTTTSSRSLSTPSYHLGIGGNYPIRTDGPFMVAGFQDQSIKPNSRKFPYITLSPCTLGRNLSSSRDGTKQFGLFLFLILVDPTIYIPHIGQRWALKKFVTPAVPFWGSFRKMVLRDFYTINSTALRFSVSQ